MDNPVLIIFCENLKKPIFCFYQTGHKIQRTEASSQIIFSHSYKMDQSTVINIVYKHWPDLYLNSHCALFAFCLRILSIFDWFEPKKFLELDSFVNELDFYQMSGILVQKQAVKPIVRKIFKLLILIGYPIESHRILKMHYSQWKLYFQDLVKKPNSSFLAYAIYICR